MQLSCLRPQSHVHDHAMVPLLRVAIGLRTVGRWGWPEQHTLSLSLPVIHAWFHSPCPSMPLSPCTLLSITLSLPLPFFAHKYTNRNTRYPPSCHQVCTYLGCPSVWLSGQLVHDALHSCTSALRAPGTWLCTPPTATRRAAPPRKQTSLPFATWAVAGTMQGKHLDPARMPATCYNKPQ